MPLLRLAAAVALVLVACGVARAQTPETITLGDAFSRVARTHPDLRLFDPRRQALAADADRAALRPPLVAGAELENFAGTGRSSGLQGAESTLTLASVLERGGGLDARRALAQSRIDALATERESRRLDLLAEVARRYLAVVAARRQSAIAGVDIDQRRRAADGARRRLEAGASPESVLLGARAALARAEMERDRSDERFAAARRRLAALWGERAPAFDVADVDPLSLPEVPDFDTLDRLLRDAPELRQFVGERRIREARLQLARSRAVADIDWQVGVRHLQDENDFALVASLSVPLGAGRRARPDIRAAAAELTALEIEREAADLSLYSTLADAHGRYRVARMEVQRLARDVLPVYEKAEAAAERAYRAGAAGYLEWAQLQSGRTEALRQQLDAALEAQRALIEIQRLTGQPFVAAAQPLSTQGTHP